MTLTEEQNVTALLGADSAVENSLATQNGTDYVVYRDNDTLRPLSEWLPAPETRQYSTDESFPYAADSGPQATTVTAVTNESATVEWTAPRDRSVELTEGGNVTLASGEYFAHFPDEETVQVVSVDQYPSYQQTLSEQEYFHERTNGLWGVSILGGIAAVLMLGMAYLPVRG
jgi:IS1 family transposase